MRAMVVLLVLASSCASTSGASFFVGTWTGVTHTASGASSDLKWTLNAKLEGEATAKAFDVLAHDAWSREGEGYVRRYEDSTGTKGLLRSRGWAGDTWTWEGTVTTPDGKTLELREVITRLNEKQFHARYEEKNGDAWGFSSEETLTRE